MRRCHDKNSKNFSRYGVRGVTIQKDWYNFQNFAEWYTNQTYYGKGWDLDKDVITKTIGRKSVLAKYYKNKK